MAGNRALSSPSLQMVVMRECSATCLAQLHGDPRVEVDSSAAPWMRTCALQQVASPLNLEPGRFCRSEPLAAPYGPLSKGFFSTVGGFREQL